VSIPFIKEVTVGRKKLFTTFPRRLLDDDAFIRLSPGARHLLYHLYAYLHPHGRAPLSELMLSRCFVPQLFPKWDALLGELQQHGFVASYTYCEDPFFCLVDYDDDQPANLIRDRGDCNHPAIEDADEWGGVIKQDINCEETAPTREEKKKRKKKRKKEMSGEFLEWYEMYPRKDGPVAPWDAWQSALERGAHPTDIIDGLAAALISNAFPADRKFRPMATTWLNQQRWLADYSTPQSEMESEDLAMLKRLKGEE
jgi:hypothetical protein